jgi:hypothetical protein
MAWFLLTCLSLIARDQLVLAQESRADTRLRPVETTVCKILADPGGFNNKLVRVRGYVTVNFEYSTVRGNECSDSIWFTYGGRSVPPPLAMTIDGTARPGATNEKGRRVAPIKVKLVRDINFDRFEKLMISSAKANAPIENWRFVQRVTATFIGRIDSVSSQIHNAHQRRYPHARPDSEGFGQMGLFDVQLVVQNVESDSVAETFDVVTDEVAEPIEPPGVPLDLPGAPPFALFKGWVFK